MSDPRDLLVNATERPWVARHEAYEDDSGPWAVDGAGEYEAVVTTGGYDGWFKGGVDDGADAALIVAAVNSFEAFLDLEQAARKFADDVTCLEGADCPHKICVLNQALARLDEIFAPQGRVTS